MGAARADPGGDTFGNECAVGTFVVEIADKDGLAGVGMVAPIVIAELLEQPRKCARLSVDVADDVKARGDGAA